jgi:hypothetical protein
VSSETTQHCVADRGGRTVGRSLPEGARPGRGTTADASWPGSAPAIGHYDLAVRHACEEWTKIRWSLFVFPDITDVAPTDDPGMVRIFYEGRRPYPNVWRVELLQAGFDVPALDAAQPSDRSSAPARPPRLGARANGAAGSSGLPAMEASGHRSNGHGSNGRRR